MRTLGLVGDVIMREAVTMGEVTEPQAAAFAAASSLI